ncbi:Protein of unknown function DUF1810 [Methylocella silvestris BL2]|uniref:Calpastatin n=1 Tax=Methylocella silvestris (strain DSM 15510 / CIP 108128 / LMG 27833 / NCIMB 13906 / BL2) TaxID=395965 RepID=B8EKQ0_METSB|nr:DUF1810 domain-containing protein [Methylocella silvestris]ACK51928.1 Protein of unknown function DUF1810 [Methylocella silvestris BL2]
MAQPDPDDPFDLRRFVEAQEGVFERACAELRRGRKATHWMWFIFPQIAGLGSSAMAQRYAVSGRAEAQAYLRDVILGPRLKSCAEIVNVVEGRSAAEIFGYPDTLKFQSSMTLFAATAEENRVFREALDKYFGGERDQATLERL